ncbi:MbnP family protein [Thalassotalea mangrovi]|uniref:Copper-binding protein MbnP-like domain-containing protein n=1 Tax=Thalassotalea mangrovi TaxID=2572245 RepID=A0A4U1B2C9_9GAMM|nr:MbnP family protein [Thalassotalea mangrovi]TKB43335.1 hypothetical protein E8M12_15175 [Thalassotalea mangrovi]
MTKTIPLLTTLLLAAVVAGITWQLQSPKSLTLRFYPYMGEQVLVFNDLRYQNPGGPGKFLIRDLQLFISNIHLIGKKQTYRQPDSYHLLRFDNDKGYFDIVLKDVALNEYDRIELGIGVDPDANGSIVFSGDLDPNGRMAWNWQVGYKFLLLEGRLTSNEKSIPLVYHIGFDESYTRVTVPLANDSGFFDQITTLKVDFSKLFMQETPVNMEQVSTVKFDPDNVRLIAQAFPDLLSIN